MVMPRSQIGADHRHHVADLGRVEAGEHLVEQQKPRLDGERARKLQSLAPRDRKARGRTVEHRPRPTACATSLGSGKRIGARGREQMRADRDVLPHRQAGKRLHDLEGARDAAPRQQVRRHAGDVVAGIDDAAFAGRRNPVMIANRVVLPAPFGPISAVMRPASAVIDALIDRQQPAEPLRDLFDPQQSLSHGGAPAMGAPALKTRAQADEDAGDAARRERHDQHQHAAIDHQIEARRVAGHELGQFAERLAPPARRATDRTPCRSRR